MTTVNETQQRREIPLYEDLPVAILSKGTRRDITHLVFGDVAPLPKHIDTVMALSAADVAKPQAARLKRIFTAHHVGHLVVTGGEPWKLEHLRDIEPDLGQPQSDVLLNALGRRNIPPTTVVSQERTSTNTKENVAHAWAALKTDMGREIAVVTNTWHMGRGIATVRAEGLRQGWSGNVLAAPFASAAPSGHLPHPLYQTTWHKSELGRGKVGGELKRLWVYGNPERNPDGGDIYTPPEDRTMIGRILETVDDYMQGRARGRTVTVPGADLAK